VLVCSPAPVDDAFVAGLHEAVQELLGIDHRQGGAAAALAAAPVVRTAYERLAGATVHPAHPHVAEATVPVRLRRDVVAGMGELLEVYGWFLHDAGQPRAAYRMSRRALTLLRRSGHRSLELLTVQNLALQAQTLGRPATVLDLVRPVIERNRPTGWLSALFLARKAQALAQLGQRADALRTFAQAKSLYLNGPSGSDPEWATWIDLRQLNIFEAMTWSGLGDHNRAAGLFAETLAMTPVTATRNRYSLSGYLLAALVRAGDWRNAADLIPAVVPQIDRLALSRDSGVLWRATTRALTRPKLHPGLSDAAVHLQEALLAARSGRRYGVLGGGVGGGSGMECWGQR
jgi:tetratricopeptide (TPR) repeat protein